MEKAKPEIANRGPRAGWQIFETTYGRGVDAERGFLITDGNPFPMPIAFAQGDGEIVLHAAEEFVAGGMSMDYFIDLTYVRDPRDFPAALANNLLFPVTRMDDDRPVPASPAFHAARYQSDIYGQSNIARFVAFTPTGFRLMKEAEAARKDRERRAAGKKTAHKRLRKVA